ncbi:NAD(P)H-dependent oxidoreductase [Microvirga splendida]|uniref:NAD(P)H-dependent oxidoreductase n=1 Tax=Microvirga splendida TaxID=2795727 RepID=A0ABS0Y5B6_9HYPH|nr:NAD(P)H-dependent oxidoreductase [Microvirga splendida]MBJ6127472.1 NAD(P)H-dependent oxidoreductase [Microvirga splendida]
MTRIVIIQGHPALESRHFCHAVADAYAQGAAEAGHEVRFVSVAGLEFPLLRSKSDWEGAPPPPAIVDAQQSLAWAEHFVIVYPLWLGGMPALLKGFMEQAFRPAFMTGGAGPKASWKTALKGRSSRIIITMGMPAFAYRWYFGAHSLKSLKRSILSLVGIGPNRHTLIGMIEGMSDAKRKAWLGAIRRLGAKAR